MRPTYHVAKIELGYTVTAALWRRSMH